MGVGNASPIKSQLIWETLDELAELLKFTITAKIEKVLFVVAIAFPLLLLHEC